MTTISILSNQPKAQKKKAKQIIDIYNQFVFFQESYHLKNAKTCTIACVDGVKGGVIAETYGDLFTIIQFAAFEEKDQNKGYASACIKALKKQCKNIVGVQIDFMQPTNFWQKHGFITQVTFNLCPTLINITEKEFTEINITAGGKENQGLSLADLAELQGK
jgi:hypothetical protein